MQIASEMAETYTISTEERQFYEDNGYLVIKGLIDFTCLYGCKQRFINICKGVVDRGGMVLVKEPSLAAKGAKGEQLINKDLYYFPFRPAEKIIAAWTAIDDVTIDNGCLYVVPGSHKRNILYEHGNLPGYRKSLTAHYAHEDCHYIDVSRTVQEPIAREVEAEAERRGFRLSFADVWQYKSKSIASSGLQSKL
ncbi:jg7827 [Pararge aegeria aegeria]|uniref:phytanoyl-CoA dioxygenase n=1 Tax=Pararge aegeria aegeria TaxID=348720 RepID=A0A8S4RKZ4_9NEOP|nr:jg7827 [Pararge aegeria aegeria]